MMPGMQPGMQPGFNGAMVPVTPVRAFPSLQAVCIRPPLSSGFRNTSGEIVLLKIHFRSRRWQLHVPEK